MKKSIIERHWTRKRDEAALKVLKWRTLMVIYIIVALVGSVTVIPAAIYYIVTGYLPFEENKAWKGGNVYDRIIYHLRIWECELLDLECKIEKERLKQ